MIVIEREPGEGDAGPAYEIRGDDEELVRARRYLTAIGLEAIKQGDIESDDLLAVLESLEAPLDGKAVVQNGASPS